MSVVVNRHEIHQMLDNLPPEVLPDVFDYLDFLRYRAGREAPGARIEEAIRLYIAEEISLGRAAELAEVNYFKFGQILRTRGIKPLEPLISESGSAISQKELVDEVLG